MNFFLPNFKKIWKNHRPFLIVLIIVFLLRLPLLFEPFTYADEGIYLTLGQAVRKGLTLYRDIHDNKPPLLYLIAAATGTFSLYRLIHFLWSFFTIFIFYKFSQLVFPKKQKAIIISTAVFAILTSLPTFEGNIANAENFMLLPTIAAFYLIFKIFSRPLHSLRIFSAGFLLGLASLFKIPAAFDFMAAMVFIFFALNISRKNYKLLINKYLLLLSGFIAPILITVFYFASQNALPQYLTAAFSQNLPYLSSWGGNSSKISTTSVLLLGRALLIGILTILLFIFRKKISLPTKFIMIWFSFSLFAALLSSRPYPHYLIQVLPAFSLSFGFLALSKKWLKSIPVFLGGVLIFVFVSFRFWNYPNLPYLLNFYQFVSGSKSHQEYLNYFGHHAQSLYQTADFIRTHTLSEEKIFIWGNRPSIYALSQRLPVGRYTVAYHIIDFKAQTETIEALQSQTPRWLIVSQDEDRVFPQLEDFINNHYLLFQKYDQIKIFYRLPKAL